MAIVCRSSEQRVCGRCGKPVTEYRYEDTEASWVNLYEWNCPAPCRTSGVRLESWRELSAYELPESLRRISENPEQPTGWPEREKKGWFRR